MNDAEETTEGLFVVANAPAGWYQIAADMRRWFDGREWTDYYAPVLDSEPDVPGAPLPPSRFPLSRASVGFHLIMVVATMGFWLPILLIVVIVRSIPRRLAAPIARVAAVVRPLRRALVPRDRELVR